MSESTPKSKQPRCYFDMATVESPATAPTFMSTPQRNATAYTPPPARTGSNYFTMVFDTPAGDTFATGSSSVNVSGNDSVTSELSADVVDGLSPAEGGEDDNINLNTDGDDDAGSGMSSISSGEGTPVMDKLATENAMKNQMMLYALAMQGPSGGTPKAAAAPSSMLALNSPLRNIDAPGDGMGPRGSTPGSASKRGLVTFSDHDDVLEFDQLQPLSLIHISEPTRPY